MMVREIEVLYDLVVSAKIIPERSVIGNAGEQDEPLGIQISWISLREDGLGGVVCD